MGESAFHVSEQGIGKHVVVESGGIDRHKGPLPGAQCMKRFGNQFFSGSGFSGNEDRITSARNGLNNIEIRPSFSGFG